MFSTGFNSKCKRCVKEERESKPKVKYITRAELEEENKKLKEELSKYKKQYEHSMGFMEEDTLQELKDIGEI